MNTGDIDHLAKKVLADRQVDVLVNNAGIMTAGSAYEGVCHIQHVSAISIMAPPVEPNAVLACALQESAHANASVLRQTQVLQSHDISARLHGFVFQHALVLQVT